MPQYTPSREVAPLAIGGFLDPSPSGTGARIGIGKADEQGLLLSDQDYYDRFIRQEEMALAAQGQRTAGAVGRGARIAQGDFMTAQGLGGTGIAQGATQGMSQAFRPAQRAAMMRSQMEGEELRRRGFEQRDAKLAEIGQGISMGHQMESQVVGGIMSAIPFTAPFAPLASGAIAGKGVPYSTMATNLVNRRNANGQPLQTVDYGINNQAGGGQNLNYGGGGGDFSRLYGG